MSEHFGSLALPVGEFLALGHGLEFWGIADHDQVKVRLCNALPSIFEHSTATLCTATPCISMPCTATPCLATPCTAALCTAMQYPCAPPLSDVTIVPSSSHFKAVPS